MIEDLSTVDDATLARWAFGRPTNRAEAARAQRAAEELDRRSRARAPEPTVPPSAPAEDTPDRTPRAEHGRPPVGRAPEVAGATTVDDESLPVAGRRPSTRLLVAVGLIVAVAIPAGVAIAPLLDPGPATPSSLAVFDRDVTDEEREYLRLLQREGQRVNVGPRVIGSAEYGTILAYRSLRDDPGQPERDQVCLAVAEFDRAARAPQINDWQCINRSDFEVAGTRLTLFGLGGQYDVDWGPTGPASVDVLITEAQRLAMDPGLEAVFLDIPPGEVGEFYVAEQPLFEQTGLSVEQLRGVFLVSTLTQDEPSDDEGLRTPDAEWVVAFTATDIDAARAGESARVACLAVVDDGVQLESQCALIDDARERGLQLTFGRDARGVRVTWPTTGEISAVTAEQ